MSERKRQKGFFLLQLVVSGTIVGMLMIAVLKMQENQSVTNRRLAGRSGVTDVSNMLSFMFSVAQCRTTGFFGNSGTPATVVVNADSTFNSTVDTIGFSSDNLVVSFPQTAVLAQMIRPYTIEGITLTPIAGLGFTDTGSGFEFPFLLTVDLGHPKETVPEFGEKGVFVYTDYSHNITGMCNRGSGASGGSGSSGSIAAQSCPGNQVMTGIDSAGEIICNPPVGGPPAGPPGLAAGAFGGAYIKATSSSCGSQVNPVTGTLGCPPGYTAGFVGGVLCNASDPATRKLYICYID